MFKRDRVRGFGPGINGEGDAARDGWYVRFSPNLGLSIPWFGGRRVRWARHHGLQVVKWASSRWYVEKQLLGRSRVSGERYI